MIAIKGRYDGEKVILPEGMRGLPPGEVILIFEPGQEQSADAVAWVKASEAAFASAWDNDEDAVYDAL